VKRHRKGELNARQKNGLSIIGAVGGTTSAFGREHALASVERAGRRNLVTDLPYCPPRVSPRNRSKVRLLIAAPPALAMTISGPLALFKVDDHKVISGQDRARIRPMGFHGRFTISLAMTARP
jgi:hypothetical protein